MDNTPTNAHRRKLLVGVATAAAAVPLVAGLAACQGSGEQETKAGASGAAGAASPGAKNAILTARRKLGPLEVSSVGLGVQNMSRTYQTTIPSRPRCINIIRTAFDRGVTFFDAAEAYGPHEVRAHPRRRRRAVPRRGRDRLQVRLEHRSGDRRAAPGPQQPPGPHQAGRRGHAEAPAHRSHRSALPAPGRPAGADRGRRRRDQGPDGAKARSCTGACPRWG